MQREINSHDAVLRNRSEGRGKIRPMTNELERLERTLRRNRVWLRRFLNDPQRLADDLHLLVAARLRLLLCRSKGHEPALLDYARRTGRLEDLVVWGPYDYKGRQAFPPQLAAWDPVALWPNRRTTARYPIQEYLKSRVGTWRMKRIERGWLLDRYTPVDLIKSLADSESLHHLPAGATIVKDLRSLRHYLRMLPEDDLDERDYAEEAIARALFGLGEWTVCAIDHLLE